MRRSGVASILVLCSVITLLVASWPAPNTAAAAAAATDIYQYAGECVTVRDQWSNRYVVRDALGYALSPLAQRRDAVSHAGHGPRQLPAVRSRRQDAGRHGPRAASCPAGTADPSADWMLTAATVRRCN